jgi:hypothetical protein
MAAAWLAALELAWALLARPAWDLRSAVVTADWRCVSHVPTSFTWDIRRAWT